MDALRRIYVKIWKWALEDFIWFRWNLVTRGKDIRWCVVENGIRNFNIGIFFGFYERNDRIFKFLEY